MLPTDRHTLSTGKGRYHWQVKKKTHILRSFEYDLDGLLVGPCAEENPGRHENEADKTWKDQRARHDVLLDKVVTAKLRSKKQFLTQLSTPVPCQKTDKLGYVAIYLRQRTSPSTSTSTVSIAQINEF